MTIPVLTFPRPAAPAATSPGWRGQRPTTATRGHLVDVALGAAASLRVPTGASAAGLGRPRMLEAELFAGHGILDDDPRLARIEP